MTRLALLLLVCAVVSAQEPNAGVAYRSIAMAFVPRNADVPAWQVEVKPDGSGTYKLTDNPAALVAITVSPVTLRRLIVMDDKVLSGNCETKEKNIAQTGRKTITLTREDGPHGCTFNYSDNEALNDAALAFQQVVETLRAGETLKHKHRFDHLGLDAELDSLLARAKDGAAIEFQNIAPVLNSIVADDELMSPSRRKAQQLLELHPPKPR